MASTDAVPAVTSAAQPTRKYECTGQTKVWFGTTLKRIRAVISFGTVTKGELGGWVESEQNLQQASGCAWISDHAQVSGCAYVSDHAQVSGDAQISDHAHVSGYAYVSGDARLSRDAWVCGNDGFFVAGPLGSRGTSLTVHADAKIGIRFTTGCFSGSARQFLDAVQETHGDSDYGEQYRAAADLAARVVKPLPPKPEV